MKIIPMCKDHIENIKLKIIFLRVYLIENASYIENNIETDEINQDSSALKRNILLNYFLNNNKIQ